MRTLRLLHKDEIMNLKTAHAFLFQAREYLNHTGAAKAKASVNASMKSLQGAIRHAERCEFRQLQRSA